MADAIVLPESRAGRALERAKTTAGVVAAVAGAITGMWTIYEKVKSDARQYTTASYETLAPQLNQMNEALQKLAQENQELKKALIITHNERPRPAARVRTAAATKPGEAPATKPGEPAAAAPATATSPATPAAPTAENEEAGDDPFGRIVGTVNQTREAVRAVRKVPETFQKVLESRGKK